MDPSLPVLSEEEKSEVITSQIETVPPPTATAQTLKMWKAKVRIDLKFVEVVVA